MNTIDTQTMTFGISKEDKEEIKIFSQVIGKPTRIIERMILDMVPPEGSLSFDDYHELVLTFFVLYIEPNDIYLQKYRELTEGRLYEQEEIQESLQSS